MLVQHLTNFLEIEVKAFRSTKMPAQQQAGFSISATDYRQAISPTPATGEYHTSG
jgi:hypothetical protein